MSVLELSIIALYGGGERSDGSGRRVIWSYCCIDLRSIDGKYIPNSKQNCPNRQISEQIHTHCKVREGAVRIECTFVVNEINSMGLITKC
jgi:hypothetical protein